MRSLKLLPICLGLIVLLAGCGEKKPETQITRTSDDASIELARKIQAMSPEERDAYMQQHPEANAILGGFPAPTQQGR